MAEKTSEIKCPTCRIPIDRESLTTWQDRFVKEIKCVAQDVRNGLVPGFISGLGGVFAL